MGFSQKLPESDVLCLFLEKGISREMPIQMALIWTFLEKCPLFVMIPPSGTPIETSSKCYFSGNYVTFETRKSSKTGIYVHFWEKAHLASSECGRDPESVLEVVLSRGLQKVFCFIGDSVGGRFFLLDFLPVIQKSPKVIGHAFPG